MIRFRKPTARFPKTISDKLAEYGVAHKVELFHLDRLGLWERVLVMFGVPICVYVAAVAAPLQAGIVIEGMACVGWPEVPKAKEEREARP